MIRFLNNKIVFLFYMDCKIPRKYNTQKRKKIMDKITKIKDKNTHIEIFKIMKKDIGNAYSENKNGIFFNINKLQDDSIEKIINIITDYTNSITTSVDSYICYTSQTTDNITSIENLGPRLSNQEKNILKKIRKNN